MQLDIRVSSWLLTLILHVPIKSYNYNEGSLQRSSMKTCLSTDCIYLHSVAARYNQ